MGPDRGAAGEGKIAAQRPSPTTTKWVPAMTTANPRIRRLPTWSDIGRRAPRRKRSTGMNISRTMVVIQAVRDCDMPSMKAHRPNPA
jgi:hypothetical protein